MKLSKEEIAKVFALYLGCTIQHEDDQYAELIGVVNVDAHFLHEETGSYGYKDVQYAGKLLLIPLSEIKDEHAWEYYNLDAAFPETVNTNQGRIDIVKEWISLNKSMDSEVHQFLISCGYAVPLFFAPNHWANGKTAIELGISIVKP